MTGLGQFVKVRSSSLQTATQTGLLTGLLHEPRKVVWPWSSQWDGLVAVRPSSVLTRFMAERRYVEANALLVKPVAALAGTTFCRTDMRVTIDGRAVATALPRDRFGRPLPRWSSCRRVARDQFVLIAPALRASFDSRYFGPVDRAQVIGRAIPLWIWS